jgi:hypothetical protein
MATDRSSMDGGDCFSATYEAAENACTEKMVIAADILMNRIVKISFFI